MSFLNNWLYSKVKFFFVNGLLLTYDVCMTASYIELYRPVICKEFQSSKSGELELLRIKINLIVQKMFANTQGM